jgi:hypothetical protein
MEMPGDEYRFETKQFRTRYGGVSEACLLIDRNQWSNFMDYFSSGETKIGVIVSRPEYDLQNSGRIPFNLDAFKIKMWKLRQANRFKWYMKETNIHKK